MRFSSRPRGAHRTFCAVCLAALMPLFQTPAVAQYDFQFLESTDGWSFTTVDAFTDPTMSHNTNAPGYLVFQAADNTNTFGFAESQPLSLSDPASSIFLADFYVASPVENPVQVPQFRMRANETHFQRASYMAVESLQNGEFSPSAGGRYYSLPFVLSDNPADVILNFDILNFDTTDAADGRLDLDLIEIRSFPRTVLNERSTVREWTFDGSTEDWAFDSSPVFDMAQATSSPGYLELSGGGSSNAFGFWRSPDNLISIDESQIYIGTFRVTSEVPASQVATSPQFRVRLIEQGFRSSSFVVVESSGNGAHSPAAGTTREYTVYYAPPDGSEGFNLLAAFDFLNFNPLDNATAKLRLDSVLIESIENPFVIVEPNIVLVQGNEELNVETGQAAYVAFSISARSETADSVAFSQTVEPDNGGITITSDAPSSWNFTETGGFVVNEYITGNTPGTYTVTSTATIQGTNEQAMREMIVIVTEPGAQDIALTEVATYPAALKQGNTEMVQFTSMVSGAMENPPESLTLNLVDESGTVLQELGTMTDDGTGNDDTAGDMIYTGMYSVTAPPAEGNLFFQAAIPGASGAHSPSAKFAISPFDVGFGASDNTRVVANANGDEIYWEEVIAIFEEGTASTRITQITNELGYEILGSQPDTLEFHLRVPGNGTPQLIDQAIAQLNNYEEVISATPNYATGTDVFPVNDTRWSEQKNMTVIRADEAWQIARGALTIAIVDSGVDYNHPDLNDKVLKGKDHVSNDDDPMDGGTHGTHVAGIAAAESNNSTGVAGASWGSKIYAIRGVGGSLAALNDGIREAADKGYKIINISGGIDSDVESLKNAVDHAVSKGALVVGSAGNTPRSDGTNVATVRRYPGSYDNVLCVGNSTDTDGRAGSSRYGAWVDIAAPGVSVLSTVPGSAYGTKTGTSMSTPLVSGCAAVVWAENPSWTAAQVRERLIKSGAAIGSGLQIGASRVDLFEAVFNGSFELEDMGEWTKQGTVSSLTQLGSNATFTPRHRKRMGYISTGPAGDQVAGSITQKIKVQEGVTQLPIRFEYDYLSEEYDEFVGTQFNDRLEITITPPGGSPQSLAVETINGSSFTPTGGVDFPGGDSTLGHTGWKSVNTTIPVTPGEGIITINIQDAGDDIYDSVVIIDNIRMKQ